MVGVVVVVGIVIAVAKKPVKLVTITAHRGDIKEEISVTGSVASSENVDLAFQSSGRVASVNVVTGNHVGAGQILMSLDTAELQGQKQLQQAQVEEAQAKLDQVKNGARPEDIAVAQSTLTSYQNYLTQLESTTVLSSARADLNTAIDALVAISDLSISKGSFVDQESAVLQIIYGQPNLGNVQSWYFLSLNGGLKAEIDAGTTTNIHQILDDTKTVLTQTKSILDSANSFLSLNNASEADKSTITTARTSILNALDDISNQSQSLVTAENNVSNAQAALTLKQAPPTSFDLAIAQSQLDQATANLAVINAQISQKMIVSPVTGIVTAVNFKNGETATAGVVAASVINDSHFEVDSNVPETDIGKIAVGDPVDITIDAFPGETFTAKVSKVDPGKQIIDGVVDYKVTTVFDKADPRFKDGLTANLDIQTQQKTNVVVLPQVAILENDQGTFVNKIVNGKSVQTLVVIGIRAKDGNVEVISGVQEGDLVENIGIKK